MKKIIIIEDNKDIAEFYEIILTEKGYRVMIAKNRKEALLELEKEDYDLALLDLLLDDESGKDFLSVLKKKFDFPVIVITNLPHERNECLKLGADGFLVKSETEPEGIVKEVGKILSKKE